MRANTILTTLVLSAAQVLVMGCNTKAPSPEQVREKTAEATSELKENAKAVAQGVREGLARPTSDRPLDLNSASRSQLLSLPGITDDAADRIIAARPYSNTHELLDKQIISREEFNKIADSITVQKIRAHIKPSVIANSTSSQAGDLERYVFVRNLGASGRM